MVIKHLLLLANSRKFNERCVAGREMLPDRIGAWIRPVSSSELGEVDRFARQYAPGVEPEVMDVAEVGLSGPMPHALQPENWLLDRRHLWHRVRRAGWDDLKGCADTIGPLWFDGHHTRLGENDRVPVADAGRARSSLKLIHVEALELVPHAFDGGAHRRLQGRFAFDGVSYRLWVTDPVHEADYLKRPAARHDLGECYLTVSLSEAAKDGFCYKMIAAIIERVRTP
jgi:hypothetical protein